MSHKHHNTNNFALLGDRQPRVDALGKLTGQAKFAEDYNVAHQLYGAVLRAKMPHAKIVFIDVSKAKELPGVEAVLTADDILGSRGFGIVIQNQRVLADDKVRYLGDGVALVAATSRRIAEDALELIEVKYQELPGVFSPEEALRPGAPSIHDGDNTFVHHKVRKGDVKKGFGEADLILEKEFHTQHIEHAYIEPEAVLAEPGEHGDIRITGSVQNLFSTRKSVAAVLNLPLAKVQIRQATLGGSFGGKDEASTLLCCRAGLLAMATRRPVKLVNTREESMLESYKRHPYVMNYKLGAKKDGTLTAMEVRCLADGGAYASMSPFVTWRSVVQATGPYVCPNVKTDVFAVYTNNNYTGAMRGFGSPQVCFASECLFDELAEKLGKNPLELRLGICFQDGSITATGQKLSHKVSLKEALLAVTDTSHFVEKWERYRRERHKCGPIKKGIGLSCSYRGVSLGAEGTDTAGTIVSVQSDGSVIVSSGITDMGQGAQTAMSQIVAEVLGVSMDRIVFLNTNTSRVPDCGPTVASRGTIMGGNAAKKAAEIVRDTMFPVAAEMLGGCEVRELVADNNSIRLGNSKKSISFDTVAGECYTRGLSLYGFGWHKAADVTWEEETGQGDAYFTYVYGANVAEVEVDVETGKVDVVRFYSAHDVGRAINRAMVEGQIFGGVAMGMGYGLFEEFEQERGRARTLNFDEYLIATSMDVPQVVPIIIENPDPLGPFGAKSIGEPANEIAAPAIVNAIANATGRRIYSLPANLERVLLGRKLTGRAGRVSEMADRVGGGCKTKAETHA